MRQLAPAIPRQRTSVPHHILCFATTRNALLVVQEVPVQQTREEVPASNFSFPGTSKPAAAATAEPFSLLGEQQEAINGRAGEASWGS